MWCHKFKGVTYYHPHLSRFVCINYTNLFKQALHCSSENYFISVMKHTKPTANKVCWGGMGSGVGACAGGQARKAQANPPKHHAHSGAKLTVFQRGENTHSSNTWGAAFLLFSKSFGDQRRGNMTSLPTLGQVWLFPSLSFVQTYLVPCTLWARSRVWQGWQHSSYQL